MAAPSWRAAARRAALVCRPEPARVSPRVSRAPAAVSRRRDFASLGASRSRGRSGPVRVVHAPNPVSPDDEPVDPDHRAVAYGIGRSVGNAVVRNRVRRRLRVLMRECLDEGLLGPGQFLVSVGPGVVSLEFGELRTHLRSALAELG
ncbi:ribonuclease P protein component [Actinospongicola halichondriae]|uniref:ribonuclease P protein component n=1 Tax=Actinospongicola halichondriae TaxID=3236844 RepID=UPI003D4EDEF3